MRALVFDLDDTLLNSAKEIGPQTRVALDEWLASGRLICFATARPTRKVREFLPDELYRNCEIISMNGAVQHSGAAQIYKARGLGDTARRIVELFPEGQDVYLTVEISGEKFAANYHSSDEELRQWNAATRDMLIPLHALDYDQVGKIVLSRLGPPVNDLLPRMRDLDCELMLTGGGKYMTVMPCGVDKSSGLSRWLQNEDLGRSDFAVFGDELPDVRMMKLSDHAIAMSNAIPAVKAVAHDVIGHCDDDCIGPYLRKWL